jgi:glycerol-3-phosphate dehydrogenase (NAD(P)+)
MGQVTKVGILGAGGMGTALAMLFRKGGGDVRLWTRDPSFAQAMAESRTNARHLPGISIDPEIRITADPAEAARDANLLVAAVPSSFLRTTLARLADTLPAGVPVLSVVKGIEYGTFDRPSQIITHTLGPRPVAVLSGPSHAEELARGLPASVVVAGSDDDLNRTIRDSLNHEAFRVYTNPDAVGVELAGAMKNILGLAAGVCDGLEFGDNAKASLLTRGLVEIARMGIALGGRLATFYGLAGVGDVVTTCYSPFGRNRRVGERIGRGESLDAIQASMVDVAEGVPTTRSVVAMARARGVEMPISEELHRILFEGKSPEAAVIDLMLRRPKVEWEL